MVTVSVELTPGQLLAVTELIGRCSWDGAHALGDAYDKLAEVCETYLGVDTSKLRGHVPHDLKVDCY